MNSAEECVSPVNRAESVDLMSSDSSRPMSTDPNNTLAKLEKVKADRLKRMSFTRESPVINTTSGRPQSMKLDSSTLSPRHDATGSRPSSVRLSPRADSNRDFSVNSPRNDVASSGSRSPTNDKLVPTMAAQTSNPVSPMSQPYPYSAVSTPGAHNPLSNSSLNSTMPLMTPNHLQGNDTLDSIELFLLSPEKQTSIRSDVALASNTADHRDDPRDGFEKSLHLSSSHANNESNNSFDSDAHVAVVSSRIPSSYQLKRSTSQYSPPDNNSTAAAATNTTPADRAVTAALSAASAALSSTAAPPPPPPPAALQSQVSPIFTRPKELPPTLSQEAMRKPSLTAIEFQQLVSQQGDSSLTLLEQVKADRLSRRTNTDPSITATLSRSQEDVTLLQQQQYYTLPQSGSSHSLAPSTDSSLELKKVTYSVDVTPANHQSNKSNTNPQNSTVASGRYLNINSPQEAEVSPSSVVSVGYTNIPSYHESTSTFISPMGNPLPSTQQRQHNEELNQKIIAAMMAMNEKMAHQVKNANHPSHDERLHRGNSGGYFNGSSHSDPRLRDPSEFMMHPSEEEALHHNHHLQRFPSTDSGDRAGGQERGRGAAPGGARFIRRVSIDQLDEQSSSAAAAAAAPPTFSSTSTARSLSPMRPGASASAPSLLPASAVSNYRTDLHLRGRERESSRSPAPSGSHSSHRDNSHSPIGSGERRSLSPPVVRPSPPQTHPATGQPLSYNDSVPLIPDRDLAKLIEMGLSEDEARNIYKEHVTMMLIPPDERAAIGTSAMMNNSELKRKRRILMRTHHHRKTSHRSGYNENAWHHPSEEPAADNRYGSRRGSRDMLLSSQNHHYAGMRSRTSSEDMVGSAIRRNSHQELFRTSSQQRMRPGSIDHTYSPTPAAMVRRNSNGSVSMAAAAPATPSSYRRGSNGSMSHQTSVRGGKVVSRQGSLDLGTLSRRNSHNSSSHNMMGGVGQQLQERFRPGSVDITQQMPLSRRGSHNSLSGGIHNHQTGRLKSGSIDLTLHNYPARRTSREPVRRLSGDYGLGRIKMTKVNAAEIAANLLKTFESLQPLKDLLASAAGAAALPPQQLQHQPVEAPRRSSVSTLFGDVDDTVDPAEQSSDSWRPALNDYLQKNGVHRLQTLSEETEMS